MKSMEQRSCPRVSTRACDVGFIMMVNKEDRNRSDLRSLILQLLIPGIRDKQI
jgi:hypothetical protein